jgi:hypothetical protein
MRFEEMTISAETVEPIFGHVPHPVCDAPIRMLSPARFS